MHVKLWGNKTFSSLFTLIIITPHIILPMIPCPPNPQCWLCPPIMSPFSRYYSLECRALRCSWDLPYSRQCM